MDGFARTCEKIAARSSRLRKVAILAAYLRELTDDDLEIATGFLSGDLTGPGGPTNLFGETEPRRLAVGGALLREAAALATGIDPGLFRICHQECGDTGETIGLLLRDTAAGDPLSLEQTRSLYRRLAALRDTRAKRDVLVECFRRYTPLAIKYFVKTITGSFRIGLLSRTVEDAVAEAAGVSHDMVRAAMNRTGDLPRVALAARRGELERIEARLFHPMEFMLAKPLDGLDQLTDPAGWFVEDKYDGIRSQAHWAPGRSEIYSRGEEEITASFPEIAAALRQMPGAGVLDGEILAWSDGRALPFAVLQQRIARKRVTEDIRQSVPVVFMAYDLLNLDGKMLLDAPIEERRSRLQSTLQSAPDLIRLSPQTSSPAASDIGALFEAARESGNEGLVLKRRGSLYEAGRRSGAWLKLKRPLATLDVVVTAAEQGHGKRATMLSDYTFGVWNGDRLVNVGKAYSGLTDEEIRSLTRILRGAGIEKFGRVLVVKPAVVLEVAFDGIQKSSRHKGGFALRFPRIVAWRRDKSPESADTIERVRELYESSLNLTAVRESS